MKIRIVNFKKEHVDTCMEDRFPYDVIYEGAILKAHFPTEKEMIEYGANPDTVKHALCKMSVEGALIIDDIPGFEADPIVIRQEDYEIVDYEGQKIPKPDPEILLEMMFSYLASDK